MAGGKEKGKEGFGAVKRLDKGAMAAKAAVALAAIAVFVGAGVFLHSRSKKPEAPPAVPEAPAPPAVPSQVRWYDPSGEAYETGVDYILLGAGADGTRVRVGDGGDAAVVDAEGHVIRKLVGEEREKALRTALELSGSDAAAGVALSGLGAVKAAEDAARAATEEEAREAAEAERRRREDESRKAVAAMLEKDYGMTVDDFYKLLYSGGVTSGEFWERVSKGADPRELVEAVVTTAPEGAADGGKGGRTPVMGVEVERIGADGGEGGEDDLLDSYGKGPDIELPAWMSEDPSAGMDAALQSIGAALAASTGQGAGAEWDRVNNQEGKRSWLEERRGGALEPSRLEGKAMRLDDWDLVAGTIVPITLVTGIDTDLPGDVVGLVRADVFDTLTGSRILIPKGSRLMAQYNSSVAWGQKSVQVAWTQMITPDGRVYNFPGFQSVSGDGVAGDKDRYNSHFWSILGGAVLGTVIDYSLGDVRRQADAAASSGAAPYAELAGLAAGSAIDVVKGVGDQYVGKLVNRQPTVRIRTGHQTRLLVNQTISLRP